jgi:ketosteroid isomerase-like protein
MQFFAWSHDPVVFDITEIRIIAGTDLGFAYALMRCSGGRDPDLRFRLTLGLRKVENRWVVVHEHHSIPAET